MAAGDIRQSRLEKKELDGRCWAPACKDLSTDLDIYGIGPAKMFVRTLLRVAKRATCLNLGGKTNTKPHHVLHVALEDAQHKFPVNLITMNKNLETSLAEMKAMWECSQAQVEACSRGEYLNTLIHSKFGDVPSVTSVVRHCGTVCHHAPGRSNGFSWQTTCASLSTMRTVLSCSLCCFNGGRIPHRCGNAHCYQRLTQKVLWQNC